MRGIFAPTRPGFQPGIIARSAREASSKICDKFSQTAASIRQALVLRHTIDPLAAEHMGENRRAASKQRRESAVA
jgi:hypothetical protein